jgi:hypothetical protein
MLPRQQTGRPRATRKAKSFLMSTPRETLRQKMEELIAKWRRQAKNNQTHGRDDYADGVSWGRNSSARDLEEALALLGDPVEEQTDLARMDTMGDSTDSRTAPTTTVIRTCPHGHVVAACVVDEGTSVAAAARWVGKGRGGGKVSRVKQRVEMSWCDICCGTRSAVSPVVREAQAVPSGETVSDGENKEPISEAQHGD